MIEWKEEYAVNVPLVDQQHKRLFEIAGSAEEILNLPSQTDRFDQIVEIINELKDYIVFHFNAEQGILENIKYPKYLSHRVRHDDFIEKIFDIDMKKVDDDQQKYLFDILMFIMEWITEHVLIEDKIWAEYYHNLNK